MILRDPVHGLVSFRGVAGQVVTKLLGTRELQRLRRVRQLGLTSLVFPGAEHSRFAHAVGTAHVMTRLLDRIRASEDALPAEARVDSAAEHDAIAASLLHDIGHGPFSHLFEEVLPGARRHELWSRDILTDTSTDVHAALESFGAGTAERVAGLVKGQHRLGYLGRAVSSTLDVDRADYLLRDSHMTGVRYGLYDLDWLLEALSFAQAPRGEWVLAIEGRKGLPPIESFFLGRHFMYRQVYHHKATRAAECLVRGMFLRMAELVRDGSPPEPIPPALSLAARGETVSLGAFLELDDAQLTYCIESWAKGSDPALASLAQRFLSRDLPKTIPLDYDGRALSEEQLVAAVGEAAKKKGLRPDLSVWVDVTSDVPYTEPSDDSPDGLWVSLRHQPIQRLGTTSFLLGELRNKRIETRKLVCLPELRDDVTRIMDNGPRG
jgi:HD superfamily phosphohydrolase